MFEAGISESFNAWHVMPGMEGPEGELHQHDYRLEAVASREQLDERGMVCDLDVLEAALKETVDIVRDKDLDVIRPEDAQAVTVEVLSRWAHSQISQRIGDTGVEMLLVRVWESPIAFGGYAAPPSTDS